MCVVVGHDVKGSSLYRSWSTILKVKFLEVTTVRGQKDAGQIQENTKWKSRNETSSVEIWEFQEVAADWQDVSGVQY